MSANPTQLAKIADYQQKWRSLYFNCTSIDALKVESALKTIYAAMGLSAPKIEYWNGPLIASGNFNLDYWGNELVIIEERIEQNLKQELGSNLWRRLRHQIYEPLHEQLWNGIGIEIFNCLQNNYSLWHDLNSPLEENQQYFNPVMDFATTEYLMARGCWFDFAYEVLNCQVGLELWQSYQDLITNCGWLLTYKDICVVCSRPIELTVDTQMRLHGEGKPALLFADGLNLYAYEGVILPERYTKVHPSAWKLEWVLQEDNAELRRILVQGIGYDRICQASFSQELDSWREYTLLKIDIQDDREPANLLKMTCPSTGKIHALRVPPSITSAREAIRWVNWDIDPSEFTIQT
ncbi:conserved hypothetical protein [Hyella patelloides LEGE 07179]|uniref:DUF6745 domain-containing protein n=1 Tax=Hyella patelloides LEGE 07179 TaxID=945734 RepID=A0A563VQ72_9CYAN|nr:hypothetical protein [Hyella patelloides]VEP13618.1 conserved hypothetical protein [Hyella patelloides LEGE 07179]